MTPDAVARLFTHQDGSYRFARWSRPIVPVVFGVDDATLATFKGAVEAMVLLARHPMAETDPEMGANLFVFFCREWHELLAVPDLDGLLPDLGPLAARLSAEGAHHYRAFRFEADGAIRAAVSVLRIEGALADVPAETLALNEMAHLMLLWAEGAFPQGPLALAAGHAVLGPEIAGVIRAAYDPVMPAAASDPSHALRLAARVAV